MKYNISDAFENLEIEETEKIVNSIKVNYNDEFTEKIRQRVVYNSEKTADNGIHKKKRFSVKSVIAFAAAFVILLCGITAGAGTYFEPNSTLNKIFHFKNDSELTDGFGWNVDSVCESNGYELRLTQVMSDNTTLYIAFDCPKEDKTVWLPNQSETRVKFNGRELTNGSYNWFCKEDSFILVVTNYDNIKNNTKVEIEFDKLGSYFAGDTDEITDILKSQGHTDEEIEDLVSHNEYWLAYALELPIETVDGNWSFEFDTIETNVKKEFEYDGFVYEQYHTSPIKITKAEISPLAVYLELAETDGEVPSDISEEGLVIEMKDGTVYTSNDDSLQEGTVMSWHGTEGGKLNGNMDMYFKNIIDTDDVKTISLAGTVIYTG